MEQDSNTENSSNERPQLSLRRKKRKGQSEETATEAEKKPELRMSLRSAQEKEAEAASETTPPQAPAPVEKKPAVEEAPPKKTLKPRPVRTDAAPQPETPKGATSPPKRLGLRKATNIKASNAPMPVPEQEEVSPKAPEPLPVENSEGSEPALAEPPPTLPTPAASEGAEDKKKLGLNLSKADKETVAESAAPTEEKKPIPKVPPGVKIVETPDNPVNTAPPIQPKAPEPIADAVAPPPPLPPAPAGAETADNGVPLPPPIPTMDEDKGSNDLEVSFPPPMDEEAPEMPSQDLMTQDLDKMNKPEKKKKEGKLLHVLGGMVILLLFVGGAIGLMVWGFMSFDDETEGTADAAAPVAEASAEAPEERKSIVGKAADTIDRSQAKTNAVLDVLADDTAAATEAVAEKVEVIKPAAERIVYADPAEQAALENPPKVKNARPNPQVTKWVEQMHTNGISKNRMFIDSQLYALGATVNEELNIRWVAIDTELHYITFEDENGVRYEKDY